MAARKIKRTEQLPEGSPYTLLLRLASGGMGAVFLGLRKGTVAPLLAIKRPHAHLAEETEFRKMFVAEARLASRIHHPNAIGVNEVLETDGELLMVMSYVDGGTLAELITAAHAAGRRVPAAVAVRIVVDAARGLHAAHEQRGDDGRPLEIVHRDVSPQNILVSTRGVSAIVDFGVAKAVGAEATRTASEVLKGKAAYMAPEYVNDRVANRASDVFSLGVVAWEALANRRLFKGDDDIETMRRLMEPVPAPMLTELTSIDVSVAAIVARAVAKDPSKRFQTAKDFADVLEDRARKAEIFASPAEVAATLTNLMSETLAERHALLQEAFEEWLPRPLSARIDLGSTIALTMDAAGINVVDGARTIALPPSGSHPAGPGPQTPPSSPAVFEAAWQPTSPPQQTGSGFEVRSVPAASRSRRAIPLFVAAGALAIAGAGLLAWRTVETRERDSTEGPSSMQRDRLVAPSATAQPALATTAETTAALPSSEAPPTLASQAPRPAPSSPRPQSPQTPPKASSSGSWKPKANPY
jgi:serine/threonine-protein kinase